MAYDGELADRVRGAIGDHVGLSERKMFGGLAFMLDGNMACGVIGDEMMVRVGPDAYPAALAKPGAREMDFTGRPMRGMVMVAAEILIEDDRLAEWVDLGADYAGSLPPK